MVSTAKKVSATTMACIVAAALLSRKTFADTKPTIRNNNVKTININPVDISKIDWESKVPVKLFENKNGEDKQKITTTDIESSTESEVVEASEEKSQQETEEVNTKSEDEIVSKEVVYETPATTSVWGDVVPASYGSSYGTISCDKIGLYATLIWGDDQELLNSRSGICQYTGSSQIGYGGCHLLCGHNDSTFSLLRYVSIGDKFVVSTSYGTYVYQVTSAEAGTVATDASTVYSNTTGVALVNLGDGADALYMYTCYPFGYYNSTSQRYVVRAERI